MVQRVQDKLYAAKWPKHLVTPPISVSNFFGIPYSFHLRQHLIIAILRRAAVLLICWMEKSSTSSHGDVRPSAYNHLVVKRTLLVSQGMNTLKKSYLKSYETSASSSLP